MEFYMKIENGTIIAVTKDDLKNGILEIPLGVKKIGDAACFGLEELNYVDFPRPNTVTKIGKGSFASCPNLHFINIPEGMQSIAGDAFAQCINLKQAYLPTSLEVIDFNAFTRCYSLESINLQNVTFIGKDAFKDCVSLKKVYCEKITMVQEGCFENCVNLEEVDLTSRVLYIRDKAFSNCMSLKKVFFAPIKSVKNYTRGLQSIGAFAFANCQALEEIEIPETVLNLGFKAFDGCKKLKKVHTILDNDRLKQVGLSNAEIVK